MKSPKKAKSTLKKDKMRRRWQGWRYWCAWKVSCRLQRPIVGTPLGCRPPPRGDRACPKKLTLTFIPTLTLQATHFYRTRPTRTLRRLLGKLCDACCTLQHEEIRISLGRQTQVKHVVR